ncbi:hypothetical protein AQUCO_05700024v1 [Aquilegia coerulea]|uniref:Uncharacterized protein n=1 Tax=Aquilegia coerulea TaxID=218851 RepID=A0A2G5CFH2_AQUCA|nr:hypothetical protein AQUCO_05700024v1 [Aquilegia coerulea]
MFRQCKHEKHIAPIKILLVRQNDSLPEPLYFVFLLPKPFLSFYWKIKEFLNLISLFQPVWTCGINAVVH